jgi:hypothetical protein
MGLRRPTFKQAALASVVFLAVWYGCLVVVAAAIILIARVPWPVAGDFLSKRRTVLAVGVFGPVGLMSVVWIQAFVGWVESAIERRWPEDVTESRHRRE